MTPLRASIPILLAFAVVAGEPDPKAWTGFRGPNRDGHADSETGLLKEWPEGGPELIWTNPDVGTGHGSPIAADGSVYLLGKRGLLALDAATGKERWRTGARGTNATPSLVDGRLYTQENGAIACYDARDGKELWRIDVMRLLPKTDWKDRTRYGSWHGSPVVADGRVVVVTGHPQAPVVALDAVTGKEAWRATGAKNASSRGWSSPIVVTRGKTRLVVAQTAWHLLGIDLADGTVLWEREIVPEGGGRKAGNSLGNVPAYADGTVYVGGGYAGATGRAYRLADDGRSIEEVWTGSLIRPFQESMIVVDGKLYGHGRLDWRTARDDPDFLLNGMPFADLKGRFHPAPGATDKKQELRPKGFEPWNHGGQGLACQDLATGSIEGFTTLIPSTHSFAGLMLIHADGMLYGTWSWTTGRTYLIEPGPAMAVKGQVTPPLPDEVAQQEKWEFKCFSTPMVYRGRLHVRVAGYLFCYDIRAR